MALLPLSHSIAIVDDDADCRVLLSRLVKNTAGGKSVQQFEDGQAFVSYLTSLCAGQGGLPSVLFLDINMPRMNGFEVLDWLAGRPEFKRMVKVVLSTVEDPASIARARGCGAHCYLIKFPAPETIKALLNASDALHLKRTDQAADADLQSISACLPFPVPAGRSRTLRSDLNRTA